MPLTAMLNPKGLSKLMIQGRSECIHQELKYERLGNKGNNSKVQSFKGGLEQLSKTSSVAND